MIEYLGLAYAIGKDAFLFLEKKLCAKTVPQTKKKICVETEPQADDKVVNNDWLEKSGFKTQAESQGYKLRWSDQDKVESRCLDGYEIVYQIDESRKILYRLVNKSGQILIGKKPNSVNK